MSTKAPSGDCQHSSCIRIGTSAGSPWNSLDPDSPIHSLRLLTIWWKPLKSIHNPLSDASDIHNEWCRIMRRCRNKILTKTVLNIYTTQHCHLDHSNICPVSSSHTTQGDQSRHIEILRLLKSFLFMQLLCNCLKTEIHNTLQLMIKLLNCYPTILGHRLLPEFFLYFSNYCHDLLPKPRLYHVTVLHINGRPGITM